MSRGCSSRRVISFVSGFDHHFARKAGDRVRTGNIQLGRQADLVATCDEHDACGRHRITLHHTLHEPESSPVHSCPSPCRGLLEPLYRRSCPAGRPARRVRRAPRTPVRLWPRPSRETRTETGPQVATSPAGPVVFRIKSRPLTDRTDRSPADRPCGEPAMSP